MALFFKCGELLHVPQHPVSLPDLSSVLHPRFHKVWDGLENQIENTALQLFDEMLDTP